MADTKISALSDGNPAQSGDEIPIARSGANYKITAGSIAALASSGVTINTTTITGGTSGRILYDNAGTVGEKAVTGSGDVVLATSPTLVTPALGTPSSATLTNATGLPVSTGISGLGTGVATALAVNVESSGAFVTFGGALGTPSSGTLTNATGLPIGGLTGLGTGVGTALAVNVGTAGAFVVNGGALGTPSSGILTNATGLPISTGVSGLGTGVATFLATPSSANLAAAVTDETGSGSLVFATSPTLTTPNLGTPSALTLTNATGLPIGGLTGLGTGVGTALAVNVGTAGAFVINGGALGTPSSGTLTNATGLPVGGISATGTPSASTYLRGDGSWQSVSATPGGSNTQVQFNDGGAFGGNAAFTFDKTTGELTTTWLKVASGGYVYWNAASSIDSQADGLLKITNNAGNDFGRLQFGGDTSSYPSLKRSGTDLQFRLANDSAYSAAAASALKIPGSTSGTVTVTAAAAAGTWTLTLPTSAGTNGYVLQTDGSGNTSWVAQSGGGGGITIGTTTITSGTSGRILYDNAGVVDEKAVTGTGDVVLATSPTLVTPALGTPSSATLTNATGLPVGGISATGTPSSTTFLRGDGAWAVPAGGGGGGSSAGADIFLALNFGGF